MFLTAILATRWDNKKVHILAATKSHVVIIYKIYLIMVCTTARRYKTAIY